jgi:multicomponent Na+:H+ antiporter subunit F
MADLLMLISGGLIILAGVISLYRFAKGPNSLDRVVAFDVLTIISLSIIAYLAHHVGRVIYLDVAIVYGILSFLGVIVIARYLEKGL